MLRRVEIKNFRSCKDVIVEMSGGLLVLVGKNGAGKTNLLNAIEWAARCATSLIAWDFEDSRNGEPLEVKLQFDAESKPFEYSISVRIMPVVVPGEPTGGRLVIAETLRDLNPSANALIIFSRWDEVVTVTGRAEPLKIGQQSSVLPTLATLLPTDDEFVIRTRSALHFLDTLRYYPLEDEPKLNAEEGYNLAGLVILGDAYAKWLARYKSSGDAGPSVLLRLLHLAIMNAEEFGILKSILGENGLGLIDAITHEHFAGPRGSRTGTLDITEIYHFLAFTPTNAQSGSGFRYGSLSLGTRRVVRILVHLLFDHSSVMLIEQPEDGLHQGMTKKLIGMLKANAEPTQLIISSHSSALLNSLTPDEVRLVFISDGVTNVRSLSARELEAAANFMNKDGTLSDFLETVQE